MGKSMKKTIRPLGDRVVLTKLENPDRSAGGIILPQNAKGRPVRGEVVSKGPGTESTDTTIGTNILTAIENIEIGDVVLYPQFTGNEIELDGVTYLVISADELLGVVE